ncbi:MAG TPA: MerR family transcriptional regulator, partial [Acidimicrobiales bacterium]|nr:MerR family transcriptional regulator [Acidimicrobiales bacterium]
MSSRTYLSIGDVLSLLRQEFPDITISKIRFLESQGLVNPERSPSGYRKFYDHDVERLRWVLRQQREHFLPLKVIRDRLVDQAGQPGGSGLQADPSGPDGSAEGAKAGAEVAAAGVAAAPQAALVAVASSAHTRAPERAEGQPAAPGPQDPGRSVEASPPAPGDAPAPANAATTNAPAGDALPGHAPPGGRGTANAATANAPAGDAPPGHAPAGGRGTSSAPGQAREVAGAPSLPGLREPGPGASGAGTGADLPSGVGVARAAAVPADPLPAAPEAARAEDPGSQP